MKKLSKPHVLKNVTNRRSIALKKCWVFQFFSTFNIFLSSNRGFLSERDVGRLFDKWNCTAACRHFSRFPMDHYAVDFNLVATLHSVVHSLLAAYALLRNLVLLWFRNSGTRLSKMGKSFLRQYTFNYSDLDTFEKRSHLESFCQLFPNKDCQNRGLADWSQLHFGVNSLKQSPIIYTFDLDVIRMEFWALEHLHTCVQMALILANIFPVLNPIFWLWTDNFGSRFVARLELVWVSFLVF